MHFRWVFKLQTEFQLCSLQKEISRHICLLKFPNFLCLQGLRYAMFWRRVQRFLVEHIQHHISRHTICIPAFLACFYFYQEHGTKEIFLQSLLNVSGFKSMIQIPLHSTILHRTHTLHACILYITSISTHLFPGEHVLVEIKLNLFICNVNAQLLKGIFFEIFKAKYIQNANAQFITIATGKLKRYYFELLFTFLGGN